MTENSWAIVTAASAGVTAFATIIYVIVTRQIALATVRQADISRAQIEISAEQCALHRSQQRTADVERLSSVYYDAYDLWRYSALLDDRVSKGIPVAASPEAAEFLPLFQAFMATKMPILKALASSADKEIEGLWFVDNMVSNAKSSGNWMMYAEFKTGYGGFYDLFGRLKRVISDEIQKR